MLSKFLSFTALKRFKENHIGKYDETDEYIYTNKVYFIPNAFRPLIGMKKIRRDRRVRRYGRIKGHLFNYITAPMVLITLGLLYVVIKNVSTLLVFFNTNIYLNGIIVSLMIFGILRVFFNSYLLFRAASFIRDLERIGFKEKITSDDVYKLRTGLEKKGELLNTLQMSEVIDHIEEKGFLNITDNQARFIKSKLGFRASRNRQGVNFISGILVMLGLLGTFLGLLATIDSVGNALNSMANLGGDGDIGMEQMTSFISSLAAPLQGMGLAFSSSLFGLSGSLLIGFFLHLAGTPQNFFIENVSRWIDDNIKKFHPKDLAKKAKDDQSVEKVQQAKAHATDQDLKDWLTGYVYLSTQTQKSLSELSETIAQAGSGVRTDVQSLVPHLEEIANIQNSMEQHVGDLSAMTATSNEHLKEIRVSVKDVQDISHVMNTALTSIDVVSVSMSHELTKMTKGIQDVKGIIHQEAEQKNAVDDKMLAMMDALKLEASKSIDIGNTANAHIEKSALSIDELKSDLRKYSSAFYKELKYAQQLKQDSAAGEQQLIQHIAKIETYLANVQQNQSLYQAHSAKQSKVISGLLETLISEHEKLENLEKHVAALSHYPAEADKPKGMFSFFKKNNKPSSQLDGSEDE